MIADFIVDKMSAYIAGGMNPETAARFTRGELEAVYKGEHYSRDSAGEMRPTAPPEDIPIEAAREKCHAAIREILDYIEGEMGKQPLNTETKPATDTQSGFEKMAEYAGRKTA